MTLHVQKLLLEKESKLFYKVGALDDRIRNIDQFITVDIAKFSDALAECAWKPFIYDISTLM